MTTLLQLPQSNLQIAYRECGKGPALFFVHGVSESMLVWKYAVEQLQQHYRCILIDLPGHGDSTEQRGSFTISFFAGIVLECIDALKLDEAILCGHSMGGQISIVAALRAPSRVSKLVLVNSAGLETFSPIETQQLSAWAQQTYSAPVQLMQLRQLFLQHFRQHSERAEELAQLHASFHDERRFRQSSEMLIASIHGMLNEPVFEFLPALTMPVHILYGDQDRLIPNRWLHPRQTIKQVMEDAAIRIPNAHTEALPGCGHYAPLEDPELFASTLIDACGG